MQYIRNPYDAEMNAAGWMRQLGYLDARVTQRGADHGLDVVSSQAVAQVKWQTARVGRPALQNLFGARGHRNHLQMLFFSSSGYSRQAVFWANEHGVALFHFDGFHGALTPVNQMAHRTFQNAPRPRIPASASHMPAVRTADKGSFALGVLHVVIGALSAIGALVGALALVAALAGRHVVIVEVVVWVIAIVAAGAFARWLFDEARQLMK